MHARTKLQMLHNNTRVMRLNPVKAGVKGQKGMADQNHLVANTLKVHITRDSDVRST